MIIYPVFYEIISRFLFLEITVSYFVVKEDKVINLPLRCIIVKE
jgi:hypothetical protein